VTTPTEPSPPPTRPHQYADTVTPARAAAVLALMLLSGAYMAPVASQEAFTLLEEVTVTATLLEALGSPVSATVLTERDQRQRGAAHLEDMITLAPNVASSSGASRNRFFQIRGIGERSQFVEPVNPSVGILLDGIDMSGAGGALTLYDLEQVEILRGPQGTLMGANALAGLIALRSQTSDSSVSDMQVGWENYGGRRLGARLGGTLSERVHARFAVQHYENDGYVDNHWLQRNDTNARGELTARGTFTWESASHSVEGGIYYTQVDNGYDAFSLDNTRATLSDQPGKDDLTLKAGRVNWQATLAGLQSSLQISHADTQTRYGYDEDWSYVGIAPGWEYSSYDEYHRDREMSSFEWRLQAPEDKGREWIIGTYLRAESEDLRRQYTYLPAPFTSSIDTDTMAFFGQVNQGFTEILSGFAGARIERRDSEYDDSAGVDKSFGHTYWTGRLGLIWRYQPNQSLFATLARGARAGSANAGLLASVAALPEQNQSAVRALGVFNEETLISAELGWQADWAQHNLFARLTAFSMERDDQQAKGSLVIPRRDGSTAFIDYTDNAAKGRHRGLEWEVHIQPAEPLLVHVSIGLLDARFNEYVDATGSNLSGRDQPQAPDWQYAARFSWQLAEATRVGVDFTGSDSYFFSDRHDVRAPETHLLNASLSGDWGDWRWTLWGRNLTNETTFVRGFGTFGNDPRKEYVLEPYRQYGEPRIVGLTLSYDLRGEMR
jgi:iron complex outermembrane recepter protein